MSTSMLTRRAALAAFGAAGLAAVAAPQGAFAHSAYPQRGIQVDVAPLRANAGDPTATWVARELPAALGQAQAERGGAGAPISVRIDYVLLGPTSGGVSYRSPDQMVGAVTVGGVERPLRASTSYYPNPVDQVNVDQSNHDRVSQLVQAFAYWAVREV